MIKIQLTDQWVAQMARFERFDEGLKYSGRPGGGDGNERSSSMSTTEPKAGEWWWVEGVHDQIRRVAECIVSPAGIHYWRPDGDEEWICATQFRPLARIPDPPAPEPTEAEKIDARRTEALFDDTYLDPTQAEEVVKVIRRADEAAGYVTVRTEGPMFERMVEAMRAVDDGISTGYSDWLRAALSAAKGDAR